MKKIILICLLLLVILPAQARSDEDSTTGSAPIVSPAQVQRAWLVARALGGVTNWKLPDVEVMILNKRVMTSSIDWVEGRGVVFFENRLLGRIIIPDHMIDTNTGLAVNKVFIVVCVRDGEMGWIHNILVHEFLHYIWRQRVLSDEEFRSNFGQEDWFGLGEDWVREIWDPDMKEVEM